MTDLLSLSGKQLEAELDRIAKENPRSYRFWTEKELLVLKRLYGRVEVSAIANTLNRSTKAIEQKAIEIGLVQKR